MHWLLVVRLKWLIPGFSKWDDWLVVWNMAFLTFHILGMSSSQLTNSYFSEGLKPPTSMNILFKCRTLSLLQVFLGEWGTSIWKQVPPNDGYVKANGWRMRMKWRATYIVYIYIYFVQLNKYMLSVTTTLYYIYSNDKRDPTWATNGGAEELSIASCLILQGGPPVSWLP